MTPPEFLAQTQLLRPRLIRAAQAITKNKADAEDAVQEAVTYCYYYVHVYDAARASLETWIMRTVYQRAFNNRRDNLWRNPQGEGVPEFNDFAPYNEQDASMRAVHDAGLEQVRMVEPTRWSRRAMKNPRRGIEPEPFVEPLFDRAVEVQSALQALPIHQRQAAEAIYMYGDSIEEYAASRGVTVKTVGRWLSGAKVLLRKDLS